MARVDYDRMAADYVEGRVLPPEVRWVAGVGERLPLGGRACAWAWVSTVVHHLDDLERAAAELRR
jgi:hypothetical protein